MMLYHNYEMFNYISPMTCPQPPQIPAPPQCPGGTIYTVVPGDTMFRIANRYGISLQELIRANPQIPNPNLIYVGQMICLPKVVTPTPPPGVFCPDGREYIVQQGDTMYNIARRFGITLEELIRANPQIPDPNVLQIGQTICIPVPCPPPPKGVCRVYLNPEHLCVLGATAFMDMKNSTVWIATFGLPKPSTIDDKLKCYYAWLVDKDGKRYFKIELKDTEITEILVGCSRTTISLTNYEEIIVTAEDATCIDKPKGPVVLRGSLDSCK